MQSRVLSQREKSSEGAGGPWLGSPPKLKSVHPDDTASKRSRGTIRVAPGETLASLAQRVYGNTHMADAIFDANRDRLRSPVLLVPGHRITTSVINKGKPLLLFPYVITRVA